MYASVHSTNSSLRGIYIYDGLTAIKDETIIYADRFLLNQNYPNPFNPQTTIEFNIPKRENVVIEVYDLLGQKVKTLLDTELERGNHKIEFNAFGLSSGIYFYQMKTGGLTITKKMIVLR